MTSSESQHRSDSRFSESRGRLAGDQLHLASHFHDAVRGAVDKIGSRFELFTAERAFLSIAIQDQYVTRAAFLARNSEVSSDNHLVDSALLDGIQRFAYPQHCSITFHRGGDYRVGQF